MRSRCRTINNDRFAAESRGPKILVPAPKQHVTREERALIDEKATPVDWEPAKRRQKDTDATWTKKHGKSYFGYKLSVIADRR